MKGWGRVSAGTLAIILLGASLAIVSTTERAGAVPPANDCTDPYWRFSLRCQLLNASGSTEAPQPNLGSVPKVRPQVKAFTRVFLADPTVRSFDGTFPVMYVDRAKCTLPVCPGRAFDGGDAQFGEDINSNHWVFSFTGGGSCAIEEGATPGVYDDPGRCFRSYLNGNERDEMTTADEPPMINLFGINNEDPADNDTFAGFNRVRIEKSSYDRYVGRISYEGTGPPGTPWAFTEVARNRTFRFNAYQHGYRMILAAVDMLWPGLTYTTWGIRDRKIEEHSETLPALGEAETVLFVGHSGGAHGLYHNIDNLAAIGWPNADVRAIFDANFVEGTENEAFFADNPPGTPIGGDAYTGGWEGFSLGQGLDPSGNLVSAMFHYDGQFFFQDGIYPKQYDAWDALLDQSCLATHPANTDWMCNDRYHVAFNHISTPFFIREDFSDPNTEHTQGHTGHELIWGDAGFYPWCPPGEQCLPKLSLAQHREHLEEQAARLLDDSATRSEFAIGTDPSLPPGAMFPTVYAWMPQCNSHEGAFQDVPFFDTAITYNGATVTMEDWVEAFVAAPRYGPPQWLVDGYIDAVGQEMDTAPPCP